MKIFKYLFYASLVLVTGYYRLRTLDMTLWDLVDLRVWLLILTGLVLSGISHSPRRIALALAQALGWQADPAQLAESRRILAGLSQQVLLLQVLNLLLDGVQILGTAHTLQAATGGLAVALVGICYFFGLQLLVLEPLQVALERRAQTQTVPEAAM